MSAICADFRLLKVLPHPHLTISCWLALAGHQNSLARRHAVIALGFTTGNECISSTIQHQIAMKHGMSEGGVCGAEGRGVRCTWAGRGVYKGRAWGEQEAGCAVQKGRARGYVTRAMADPESTVHKGRGAGQARGGVCGAHGQGARRVRGTRREDPNARKPPAGEPGRVFMW